MKTQSQIRISALSLLVILCLTVAALRASAQTLYDNGPINDNVNAWEIDGGYTVSDSFTLASASTVTGFMFGIWATLGDPALSVEWSITTQENGGKVMTYGQTSINNSRSNIKNNIEFDTGTVGGLGIGLDAGTYWLNLDNATSAGGNPLFWDENSGSSLGSDSAVGTIPSESFTILGSGGASGSTPEPSSLALFCSGVLGIGGLLRRRFLG